MNAPFNLNTAIPPGHDTRRIAAGLAANVLTARPHVITATGREAPSRYARIPRGCRVAAALMPHIDYPDTGGQPGSGFVGARISSLASVIPDGVRASPIYYPAATLHALPDNQDDILRKLRAEAGLHWAPGTLFAVAGWEDMWVAAWLDRLRENGDEAQLIIALAQAMLALRKAWLAVIWGVHGTPGRAVDLAAASGVAAVARGLIDVMAILARIVRRAKAEKATSSYTDKAICRLLTCLHHCVRHLSAADKSDDTSIRRRKLAKAIEWAKDLLDAIALFSVAGESLHHRWYRLSQALDDLRPYDHAGPLEPRLDEYAKKIEKLTCVALGRRLEKTSWRGHIRRALVRLAEPDRQVRLDRLARIRGDLIYQLAMSGRLDRLYELFPWLAAPHGAFVGCAGGALGALASLFECARAVRIALALKRRTVFGHDEHGVAQRLTARKVRKAYALPGLAGSPDVERAFMAELMRGSISHANLHSAFAGTRLGLHGCLTHAQAGRLGWNDVAAFQDPELREAAIARYGQQVIASTLSPDDDLPRYMGMTELRVINAAIHSIFPTWAQRQNFTEHRDKARDAARRAHRPRVPATGLHTALPEMQNSMLRSLDVDPDPQLRDAIAGIRTPIGDAAEVARADELQSKPTRKGSAFDDPDKCQGRRNQAAHEPVNSDMRGQVLRDLVDGAARWPVRKKNVFVRAPQDDVLEDILRGKATLAGSYPVSDLFLPVLWFAPFIDRELLAWIGRGAPPSQREATPHARAISREVTRARQWGAPLYRHEFVSGHDDLIACHVFTGLSTVTGDPRHVR